MAMNMVKISKSKNQYRITIPQEIIVLTKWNENTVLIFDPYTKEPNEKINKETPILLRGVK